MKKKIILIALAVILVGGFGVWYYVFPYSESHHRDVVNEDAINVTSVQIVKDYQTNEKAANARYLNKAVQVTGTILAKKADQAGNTTVTLKSGDAFANVFCTLKPGITLGSADSTVVIKGICSGFLSDVVLSGGIIIKPEQIPK
ncbi:OB-fold protein [Mucilaginibacter gotjawali]|uniref:tRNA_anti-like protein n=1 Tax=Mucilaginibacter gotjawali TaxID=1550579 RepID=A0A839SIP8_9SPHI|nr:hypothetical protein [Mucilaginibacter gotjawali]MBB3057173.1 hypothetical protein [Mucilaginibacter gotjawali]